MEADIRNFLNDFQWVEIDARRSEGVDRALLAKHFARWCHENRVKNSKTELFYTLMEYKFIFTYGLNAKMHSDHSVWYSGIRLKEGGEVVITRKKVNHEVNVCAFLRDGNYFTLAPKSKIVRSLIYPLYQKWCNTKGVQPLGKIRLFELMNTRESVLSMGLRLGWQANKIPVYRGIGLAEEL